MIKLIEYFEEQVKKATEIAAFENKKLAVVFPGGFTPFHRGHLEQYNKIKAAFPGVPVFILFQNAKTGKRAGILSPREKKAIILSYGIDSKFVREVKNGSLWGFRSIKEATGNKFETIILAYGAKEKKDSRREGAVVIKNLIDFKKKYDGEKPYAFIIPKTSEFDISGSEIRSAIEENKIAVLKKYLTKEAIVLLKQKIYAEDIDESAEIKRLTESDIRKAIDSKKESALIKIALYLGKKGRKFRSNNSQNATKFSILYSDVLEVLKKIHDPKVEINGLYYPDGIFDNWVTWEDWQA